MTKALVPLADGVEDLEAVSIIDVLRRGGVQVVAASLNETLEVRGAHGVRMMADARFADVAEDLYDAVVLPGGSRGTESLKACEQLTACLQRHQAAGRLLCAVCAAPTVLVAAGVVPEGVQMTCYPTCQMELDRPWSPFPVVEDGNMITGQAPGTAVLFALVVLKAIAGEAVAKKVARGMVTDVLGQ